MLLALRVGVLDDDGTGHTGAGHPARQAVDGCLGPLRVLHLDEGASLPGTAWVADRDDGADLAVGLEHGPNLALPVGMWQHPYEELMLEL